MSKNNNNSNNDTQPAMPDFVPVLVFHGVDCSRCNHKALPEPNEVVICRSVGELFVTAKRYHKQAAKTSTLICRDDQLIIYHGSAFVATKALLDGSIQRDK